MTADNVRQIERRLSELEASHQRLTTVVGNLAANITGMQEQWQRDFRQFEHGVQQLLDPLVKKIDEDRVEEAVHSEQHRRFGTIEERVVRLEGIHPKGTHAPSPQ